MTNQNHSNPYAKILARNPSISRRAPLQSKYPKSKPFHGEPPHSPLQSTAHFRAPNKNRQSRSPVLPIPPNTPPLLPDLLRKASTGLVIENSSRSPDWSINSSVKHKHTFKPPTAPYKSRSLPSNSRRSLKNSGGHSGGHSGGRHGGRSTWLSTSSKDNASNLSTQSSKVNDVNKSNQSSKSSLLMHVANAQQSTHVPSQLRPNSSPRTHPRKGVPSRNTSVSPSSPKSKRSPKLNVKRRASHPPPALSLERPTSPQEPSLNPRRWKQQVRASTKRDIVPEHASRPTGAFFPLVRQPPRNSLSPRLRKQYGVAIPRSSLGHSAGVVNQSNPRVSSNGIGANRDVYHPLQGQKEIVSVEKPELDFSSEDDKPLAQAFGPLATPRAKSPLERPTGKIPRHPAVDTLLTKPRPPPPLGKTTNNGTPAYKNCDSKPPNSDALEVIGCTNLQNAQHESRRNSIPRDPFQRAFVRPLKKRRVVENESDPKPYVFPDAPTDGTHAPVGLDLKQIEEPSNLRNSEKVQVSPVSITEAPFEVSFEDPVVAELRSLNDINSLCLLGNSVKSGPTSSSAAQRRRCLSFEQRRQKLPQPVYIADPYDERMMEEALAAVNVKFEKHV